MYLLHFTRKSISTQLHDWVMQECSSQLEFPALLFALRKGTALLGKPTWQKPAGASQSWGWPATTSEKVMPRSSNHRKWILPMATWMWKQILPQSHLEMRIQSWLPPDRHRVENPARPRPDPCPTGTSRVYMCIVLMTKFVITFYTAIAN